MSHLMKEVVILSDAFQHRFPQRGLRHGCYPFLLTALAALNMVLNLHLIFLESWKMYKFRCIKES